jgi:hypothetical protein
LNTGENDQSPSRLSHHYSRKPMRGGKHYQPAMNANDSMSQLPSSGRQSWAKYTQIGSGKISEEKKVSFYLITSINRSGRSINKVSERRMNSRK